MGNERNFGGRSYIDEIDKIDELEAQEEEEYQRARQERLRRRRLEKQRQLRQRRLIRRGLLIAAVALTAVLAGTGLYKLVGSKGGDPAKGGEEVQAELKEGEIQAQKQPVMSAADIEKMASGTTLSGWQEDPNGRWYRETDGSYYQNGWKEIDGVQYYFDENGYAKTGWVEMDGEDYYFDEEGKYDSSRVRPMVALTFDDGPGKYTDELLDCLEENNAKATFYMLGENVENYPDTVKRICDMGMELSNHTYDHQILTNLSGPEIQEEITKASDAIEKAAGALPDTLRPPGGSYNEQVQELAGMPIVKWSIDTKDWATKSEEKTYQCVMDNVTDGSVVLMHDIHEWSVKAAIRMIPELIEKGYKLVTIQEMAEAKGVELQDGEVYEYFGEGTQMVE